MDVNLDFIFEEETPAIDTILKITPQGALSMVTSSVGSYYATAKKPNHNMILGLIENAIGIHIPRQTREDILTNAFNANRKVFEKRQTFSKKGSRAYLPIIYNQVIVNNISTPKGLVFVDTSIMHWSIKKTNSHYSGSKHIDHTLVNLDYNPKQGEVIPEKIYNKLPDFYGTMKKREYVLFDNGDIVCDLTLSPTVYNLLNGALERNSLAYMGTSDGLVDVELIKK
jgi:CRISPR-associated protein Cas5